MIRSCLVLLTGFCLTTLVQAADWPQWRGPERNGISKEKGLLSSWPKGGPKLLWTQENLGIGYAGPAIVGERIYIMGGDEKAEFLYALDVETGKRVWSTEIGSYFDNAWGGGPRGTPTVDGEYIYTLGAKGNLVCVERKTGKLIWKVNLQSDLGGRIPYWGYSESPLVDDHLVLCTPGGKRGTLAALDKKTGKVVWRSTDWTDAADYSSLVVSTMHKSRQVVQMASASIGGVEIKTGKLLWQFPRSHRITIPTPITFENYVYITSGYGVGCNLLKFSTASEYEEVYANKNMVNHHGGVILLEGHIYGHSDSKGWVCQQATTGEVVWQWRKHPKGSIVYADGHFYCYAETDGTLALIEASTKGWKEKGKFKIPRESQRERPPNRSSSNIWTHPVVANGKLYLRDQELLFCYDVKKDPIAP